MHFPHQHITRFASVRRTATAVAAGLGITLFASPLLAQPSAPDPVRA